MTVEGSFIASGGEQFLTFGNFDSDIETDTLRLREDGLPVSYFYFDEVSVVLDTTYHVGIQEPEFTFSIYPNPATTNLTIESRTPLAQVWVSDVAGRVVWQETLRSAQSDRNIDVSALPSGIYLVAAITEDGRRSVQKVVVE